MINQDQLFIGLISGTSMDGIDAALLDCSNGCRVLATQYTAYPANIHQALIDLTQSHKHYTLDDLGELDSRLGKLFAQAAVELIEKSSCLKERIVAIGSHGQTIRHRPPREGNEHTSYTIQIGDPNIIAETTRITTVADFRRRDMAAGGQGAPLVPAFHAAVFGSSGQNRAVVNIGGIANITVIDHDKPVYGFDSGPGNCLMDQWTRHAFGLPFDKGGKLASKGKVINELLTYMLKDAYFKQPHPKSTGPEYFNLDWLQRLPPCSETNPHDILRTLNQLTATTIVRGIRQNNAVIGSALFCGGGVHNRILMSALETELTGTKVSTTAASGIDPDYVEAAAFAWLAKQTLAQLPGNLPRVTGANRAVILGGVYYA